ncbi:MAG: acetate kinase [Bacteroidetes bacterium GWF2_41_61]|jgi:acetate kinase|nr:MAG: acetate kinase [Bacteroidetes bacterium GWE2_40_15]OFY31466.1 MAG: acetate kinase [Bacteroidetes bacterium GWF2_41_61]OFY89000.1 MAG: acetate kinase [Bacteroidetes bacterium RIFOXYA12_FULL_40_10]PKP05476.1 MAG: acetate kinase [Bacteroidetes bacterium HGW-Bacteroidetes-5]HBG24816.1 acetate kinase [Rikenellaceae bacterium]
MVILVLNCGSSSIKYQVLDMKTTSDYNLLAKGIVERIGLETGVLSHKVSGRDKYELETPIPNHTEGIKKVLDILINKELGVLNSLSDIEAVGHRVAHGGEFFKSSSLVDESVIKGIEKLCELAPLHNPANLLGIFAIQTLMPQTPQVAVFDTSFHQTMPNFAFMYALPYEYYTKYKIRRYGFHGTSHKFVGKKACDLAGLDFENSKVITCHLGNGSSITAIKNGKSVDTSMGFTPLEGIIMGTRSGDIDAGIVTFIQEKEGLDAAGINSLLNKKSGFIGVFGESSDARDIEKAAANNNERAKLVLDMLNYRVLKYIGAYTAAMGGVDMIVFTGGIGENDPHIREMVGSHLGYMGMNFDYQANKGVRGKDVILSTPDSKVKMATVTTNEELVIAQDTMLILAK